MALYSLPHQIETRWASPENPRGRKGQGGLIAYGRKGMPYFFIRPGRPVTLAQADGQSGIIRRIWMTLHDLSPRMLRQLRLQLFWDGATRPAADVPLGDFFGMSLGRMVPFAGELFSSPEGRSLVCTVPMPFRSGMRIVLHNDGACTAGMFFYDIDYTLGDEIPADAGYFHAWYHQEIPTVERQDYTVLAEVRGRGRFLGASFGVAMDRARYGQSWGGEGEIKFFLDGDTDHPTLCGTGMEDYIGTGWCQGHFSQAWCGCPLVDDARMLLGFYRYHIPDPVFFHTSIRITFQQIGSWNPELLRQFREQGTEIRRAGLQAQETAQPVDLTDPHLLPFDLFERSDNWSSCCYFYLDQPDHTLPPTPDFRTRALALPDFDTKELDNMTEEFDAVRLVRRYLPNLDQLDLKQLSELARSLNLVVAFMSAQERALGDSETKS
jgi:hypothetical protein